MFTIEEIAEATGGYVLGPVQGSVSAVSTDSRTVQGGELFVPLEGEHFDGHEFISGAIGKGVRALLARKDRAASLGVPRGVTVVAVDDPLRALGDLASFHRRRFGIPVVGVTGSNGKTTVKEMTASIMAQTGPGLKTAGNLNNLVGLPMMLLQLRESHGWAVLEMGMSEPGEIDRLAEIARPLVGVITNAYAAHLQSMGSVEAVARAKGELFMRLPPVGTAVYNDDDPLIRRLPSPAGVGRLSFGLHGAAVSAADIERLGRHGQRFSMIIDGKGYPVALKAPGLHNVMNSLAAAAASFALGVAAEKIVAGLEGFVPGDRRFDLEEMDGIVLIDDSYNANPASMQAALETVRDIRGDCRAIAVLGDMLEMGEASGKAHLELGRLAASCVQKLYLMGEMAETVAEGARDGGLSGSEVVIAKDHEEILAHLKSGLSKGDFVLVKGSRGMAMDRVAEGLRLGFATSETGGKA